MATPACFRELIINAPVKPPHMRLRPGGILFFANDKAIPIISSFEVDDDSKLHTHKVLTLKFKEQKPVHEYNIVKLPERLFSLVNKKCEQMDDEENKANCQNQRLEQVENSKQFKVNFTSPTLNTRVRKKTTTKRQPVIDFVAEVKATENLSEHQQQVDATSFAKGQLSEQRQKFHQVIANKINEHRDWAKLLKKGILKTT